ncbi:MAG: ADP-glyceromanno-heptose 6-epimerase [Proteobacteria bacterium]|nr:ADP-glyceromanno-heptose 6-epimerase [Pseudomonadota bacterium]
MILVTGGAGFIGSNLIASLEEHGLSQIVVCDVLGSSDKWQNIKKRNLFDLITPDKLFDFLGIHQNKIEIIYHMGAISSTTEKNVDLIVQNNIRLSLDLLHWCSRHNTRFIYASSAATYGKGEFDDENTCSALAKLRPLNPYGWSKHAFDRIVFQMKEDKSLPSQTVGLKFFNVYGPNEYHKGSQMSLVPQLYQQILQTDEARLFKSYDPSYPHGGQKRDFIYVKDCVDVMLWLYDNPTVNGLFNVGTSVAHSFLDLAYAVFDCLEKERKITFIPMPELLQKQYQYFTQASIERLRKVGYPRSFFTLEEGVKDYIQNYLAKDDPYV